MYINQKGCLATIVSSIAMIALISLIMGIFLSTYSIWVGYRNILPAEDLALEIITTLIGYLIVMVIFLPAILILGGMFPAIRVTKHGLKYRYLGFLGGIIHWYEIDEIIDLKHLLKAKAIIISRKGFFILNGLWLNTIYGVIFTGQLEPILLISEEIEGREQLITEIQGNIA